MFLDSSAKMKPDFLVYTLTFDRKQGVLTCSTGPKKTWLVYYFATCYHYIFKLQYIR